MPNSFRTSVRPLARCRHLARWVARIGVLSAWLAFAACGVAEPLEDRLIGILHEQDGQPDVAVPLQVGASEPFVVTVRTLGGACVRKDETELDVAGATATVTPYDRYAIPRPGLGCLPAASTYEHTATVTFTEPGDAWVIVRVREDGSDEVTELTYPVEVAP